MNRLLVAIVVAVVAAVASVVAFGGAMAQVHWIGRFFLQALKMIIVPLVMFAMITGITSLGDVRRLQRIGLGTVLYYLTTTLLAVVVGAVLVNVIQPGVGIAGTSGLSVPETVEGKKDLGFTDLILSFVSDNIIGSMAEMDMLPLIVFSLVFGGVLSTLGERGRPLVVFCEAGNEAMMRVVLLLMKLAPIGIFGLVAGRFGEAVREHGMAGFVDQLSAVGAYVATVIAALAVHAFVVLPILLWTVTGRAPHRYARGMATALVTAFSTASSAGTLPFTIEGVERNGVDAGSANFVLPIGATVNMDGTALYEAVAAVFIAQAAGVELGMGEQLLVIVTATLAAIGAAGIPQAGLVTMVIVLRAVDLPLEGIGLILAVD